MCKSPAVKTSESPGSNGKNTPDSINTINATATKTHGQSANSKASGSVKYCKIDDGICILFLSFLFINYYIITFIY